MPFGAIYGALFFLALGAWLAFMPETAPGAALWNVRLFMVVLSASLVPGLLLRRTWARWLGAAFAASIAVLVVLVAGSSSGVPELVALFGALAAVGLLVVPATGDLRRGLAPDKIPAPQAGRVLAASALVGVVGFLAGSWIATARNVPLRSGPNLAGRSVDADGPLRIAGLPRRVGWADFGTGLERARREGKPLLVTFVASWCGYCRKMDSETWKNPSVVERLDDLVAVKVDAEDGESRNGFVGRELAAQYGVAGFPTIFLLDESGAVLARTGGFLTARQLLEWVEGSIGRDPAGMSRAGVRRVSGS